jgi:hypothetical protein
VRMMGGAEDAGRHVSEDRELCEDVETAPERLGSCAAAGACARRCRGLRLLSINKGAVLLTKLTAN